MFHADESTCPFLLGEVRDWENHAAWVRLLARHDPLIVRCCQGLRLPYADAEEVRQETWIEVAKRVRRFRYDPGRSFRNWLWVVCRHKALSFLRLSNKRRIDSFEEWMSVADLEPERPDLALESRFAEALRIQAAVRSRVGPKTWEAFWLADVYMWKVADVAAVQGASIASVHKAVQRVRARLRIEGADGRRETAP